MAAILTYVMPRSAAARRRQRLRREFRISVPQAKQ
jgi:hypothetical protein